MACGGGPLAGLDSPHAARIKHKQVLNKETPLSGANCCFWKPSDADQAPPPITLLHVINPANRCDILLLLSSSSLSL